MGYSEAMDALKKHRKNRIAALIGDGRASWFMSAFGGIAEMLNTFKSDDENKKVSSLYKDGKDDERMPAHMKLDYVCGMRREVRKQYVSEEDGIYTDVTPFRHGIISHHGAELFDDALNQVIAKKGS